MQQMTNTKRSQLQAILSQWEKRRRWQRLILYLPRIVMLALVVGLVLTLVLWLTGMGRGILPVVGSVIVAMSFIIGVGVSALGLFGKAGLEAARFFDREFHLRARLATALELLDDSSQTSPQMADLQINDALRHAKAIDADDHLRLRVNWLEWAGAIMILMLLIVVLGFYIITGIAGARGQAAGNPATQQAVSEAAADVRDITEAVATDSSLAPDERESLLESLELSQDDLQDPDTNSEKAFVSMSDLESDLREQVETMRNELTEQDSALEAASDAIGSQSADDTQIGAPPESANSGDTTGGEPSAAQQLEQTMQQTEQTLSNLSDDERQQLAEQAQQAADNTAGQLPELSENLQAFADSLQENDTDSAQEAAQQAQQTLQELQNQQEQRRESADNLEQSADRAQQAAENISRAENQPQSEQNTQSESEQASQPSDDEQSGVEAEQQGQSAPQQSEQESQQGQPGQGDPQNQQGQGQQESQQAQQSGDGEGQSAEGNGESQQPGQPAGSSDESSGASGAGQGESDGDDRPGGQQAAQSNDTPGGDGSEREFDSDFAPQNLDGGGDDEIRLETDASDAPAREGNLSENPSGEAALEYREVYSEYLESANRALERDYVPPALRDVVRDYFTSLEPDN